ncbi:amidohydrolase family protein [Actinocatenispora sera]|nr:amidohydrolase family protein [Actinocatenispora sera]
MPMLPPDDDEAVPGYLRALGLPGAIDLHVHFLPDRVLHKVWRYFDGAEQQLGVAWPITYRWAQPARLAHLRSLGVLRFPALVYPHKPGMARWLNDWALDFAAVTPDCLPSATFFPEPDAVDYLTDALRRGAVVVKSHLQVGGYDPRDPLLDGVWALLAAHRVPVVCHCGRGPQEGAFTGVGPITEVLARHPGLRLVVAHLGMPDYADFLDLARRYEHVYLDTTMAFTDFTERVSPFPPELVPVLGALADRIVLGSDFPNIPYPYAHQLAVLHRLGLGPEWLRAVLHDNAARLLADAADG